MLRTAGIVFRVYISGALGAEGMGLYQLVFSVYMLAATIATSGLSVAVTRLVAERGGGSDVTRHVMRVTIIAGTLLGCVSALIFRFGADLIATLWLEDARAVPSLQILVWSLPFMAVSNCLRGYFLARRNAGSPSVSQLLEQAVRIAVTMLLIASSRSADLAVLCRAVLLGNVISEIISCVFLWFCFRHDENRLPDVPQPRREPVLRPFLAICAPIAAGRWLSSLLHTVENLLVPGRLEVYTGARDVALAQFGALKGMALPILFFPSFLLTALSTLLVPEVTEGAADGRGEAVRRMIRLTMQITCALAILIAGLFFVWSEPLGVLLYKSEEVGFYLRVLAPLVPFMYVESIIDGLLKGLNQQMSSFKYSLTDSALRILLLVLLLPRMGINGFLLLMWCSNLLTSLLNLNRLLKVTGERFRWWKWLWAPLISTAAACALTRLGETAVLRSGSQLALLAVGLPVACALYFVCMRLCGGFTKTDMQRIREARKTGG